MKYVKCMALMLLIFSSYQLAAFPIKGGEKITIDEPTHGNLYIAGEELNINAPIYGDLVAAAGTIIIKDSLLDDALIGAGKFRLLGVAKDDIRIGAGEIRIENNVLGDLVIGGGDIEIAEGVTIFGDLIIGGGSVKQAGIIKGLTKIYGGDIDFLGIAEGETEIEGGSIDLSGTLSKKSTLAANRIKIQPDAEIKGDLFYYNETGELDVANNLSNGATATYEPTLKPTFGDFDESTYRRGVFGLAIIRFLSVALLIAVIILLFPNFFRETTSYLGADSLNSLGKGILYMVILPAIAILGFMSVIGVPIGLIAMVLFLFSLGLGHTLASIIGAYYFNDYKNKNWTKGQLILIAINIWVVLKVIGLLPLIGWVTSILVALLAYGVITRTIWNNRLEKEQVIPEDGLVPH